MSASYFEDEFLALFPVKARPKIRASFDAAFERMLPSIQLEGTERAFDAWMTRVERGLRMRARMRGAQ